MLTMHLEHDPSPLETVSGLDRDAAYPIACGENYLDPCVKELTRPEETNEPRTGTTGTRGPVGDGDGAGMGARRPPGLWREVHVRRRGADLGSTAPPPTHPPPPARLPVLRMRSVA